MSRHVLFLRPPPMKQLLRLLTDAEHEAVMRLALSGEGDDVALSDATLARIVDAGYAVYVGSEVS